MERKLRRGILGVLILMSAIFVYIESEHLAHDSKHARGLSTLSTLARGNQGRASQGRWLAQIAALPHLLCRTSNFLHIDLDCVKCTKWIFANEKEATCTLRD